MKNRTDTVLRAVVFDWDLTLWNSWDIHLLLMRRTADALGLPKPQKEAIAQEYSRPFLQHLAWFFGGGHGPALDIYLELYRECVAEMGGLFPGVDETLRALRDRGFRLAVFSDKRQAFGVPELEQTGVGHLLDYVSFLVDGRPYKPDPHGLRDVMDALRVSADETVYVGDSGQDIECAHRAGARSAAALWGTVSREVLLSQGPHYQWERVEDILRSPHLEPIAGGGRD